MTGNKHHNRRFHSLFRPALGVMAALCLVGGGLTAGAFPVYADAEHAAFARAGETSTATEVAKYGMTPIAGEYIKDGAWDIEVRSSSKFFRVHSCQLIVKDHQMTARMTMETYSYPLLCMATAEEAAQAPAEDYIAYEDVDDWAVFTVPVRGLNMAIDCAAYSKKKSKWYNRQILFDAASLDSEALDGIELPDYDLIGEALESAGADGGNASGNASGGAGAGDGAGNASGGAGAGDGVGNASGGAGAGNASGNTSVGAATEDSNTGGTAGNVTFDYEELDTDDPFYAQAAEVNLKDGRYSVNVALTGGSGRSSVSTPTLMLVKEGKAYVELLWSSPHYDWMRIGGITYQNEAEEGSNSVFTVPIPAFDAVIPVVADTTAMGDPVAIQYSLTFYEESIGDEALIPQLAAKKVVIFAVIIIVAGFFLNLIVKKKRKV